MHNASQITIVGLAWLGAMVQHLTRNVIMCGSLAELDVNGDPVHLFIDCAWKIKRKQNQGVKLLILII